MFSEINQLHRTTLAPVIITYVHISVNPTATRNDDLYSAACLCLHNDSVVLCLDEREVISYPLLQPLGYVPSPVRQLCVVPLL